MVRNDTNPKRRLQQIAMQRALAQQEFDESFLAKWRNRLAHLERGGDSLRSAVAEDLILMPGIPGLTKGHP